MGLDIYVYKAIKITKKEAQTLNNNDSIPHLRGVRVFDIDEHPELKCFETFANTIDAENYDMEKIYVTYDFEEGDIIGQSNDWENINTPDVKCFIVWELKDGRVLRIEENTIPCTNVCSRVVAFTQVGYQRKGANAAFYSEGMWEDVHFVIDSTTLTEHWNKYFSGDVKKEKEELKPNIFSSFGVEYSNDAEENRKNFKENIIDKFIDGETIVGYL